MSNKRSSTRTVRPVVRWTILDHSSGPDPQLSTDHQVFSSHSPVKLRIQGQQLIDSWIGQKARTVQELTRKNFW